MIKIIFNNLITAFLYFILEDDYIDNMKLDADTIFIKIFIFCCISIFVIKYMKNYIEYKKVIREVVPKLRP